MRDKKDLQLSVGQSIEWCARYWSLSIDNTPCNWELYLWGRIVAYNYEAIDWYIVKYATLGSFPEDVKLEVIREGGNILLTKR